MPEMTELRISELRALAQIKHMNADELEAKALWECIDEIERLRAMLHEERAQLESCRNLVTDYRTISELRARSDRNAQPKTEREL
jgi:DNA phosphorothioation-dependent restriction protein DptG